MMNSHAIYMDKLEPPYRTVFKQIRDYVTANNLDELRNEELLSDIMDTCLSAQSEGKSVEQVTGSDLEQFCTQICSGIGIKSRIINLFEQLHGLFQVIAALSIFDLCDLLEKLSGGEVINFWSFRARGNIAAYLVGGGILLASGYVSRAITKRIIFRNPAHYKIFSVVVRIITLAVFLCIVIYTLQNKQSEGTYLWLTMLICTLFLTVHRILTHEIRRYKKENGISFSDLAGVSWNMQNAVEETAMKRFSRLNRKKTAKGEPELSLAEFLTLEEKNCNKWDKMPVFFFITAVIGTIVGIITAYCFGGFETAADSFLFTGVLFAVECLLMFGLYRFAQLGVKARLAWIRTKRGTEKSKN